LTRAENNIGDEGVAVLFRTLKRSTSIGFVDLSGALPRQRKMCFEEDGVCFAREGNENIGDAGATSLADIMRVCSSLKEVHFAGSLQRAVWIRCEARRMDVWRTCRGRSRSCWTRGRVARKHLVGDISPQLFVPTRTHTRTHAHTRIHVHTHTHTHKHTHTNTNTHTQMRTHKHTHTQMRTHKHTHTHTHHTHKRYKHTRTHVLSLNHNFTPEFLAQQLLLRICAICYNWCGISLRTFKYPHLRSCVLGHFAGENIGSGGSLALLGILRANTSLKQMLIHGTSRAWRRSWSLKVS
jgi:hypothetical protein